WPSDKSQKLKKEKRPFAALCGAFHDERTDFCQLTQDRNGGLTKVRDIPSDRRHADGYRSAREGEA
ncbi:MAG: hypothetical protein ABI454_00360, partial [Sphingomicrobium sp.]